MEKILTISVAAYNTENYIEKLMNSIINSGKMRDIEVLIINDGSTDNTAKAALNYQQQYPNSVRLIDKPNGGHGSTINRGIVEATGKYFRALDGDDWVKSENLARLVKKMETIEADLIVSDYCKCYADGREQIEQFSDKLKDGQSYSFDVATDGIKDLAYHSAIYRTSILKENDIRLDEHCFYVDLEYVFFPVPFINVIYYSKDPIYCYRLGANGQSVSIGSRRKNINDAIKVSTRVFGFYEQYRGNLSKDKNRFLVMKLVNFCKWYEKTLLLFPANKGSKKELVAYEDSIKEKYPEVYKSLMRKDIVFFLLRISHYALYRACSWGYIALEERRYGKG